MKILWSKKFVAERLACQTKFWSKKSKVQKILGQKSMVKISFVTTKTFLIWTNVASKMLPGQMSPQMLASVKEGPRSLPLKFCRNRASYS